MSDLAIGMAYVSIPVQRVYFAVKFPIRISGLYLLVGGLFAAFILLCGGTHFLRAASKPGDPRWTTVLWWVEVFTARGLAGQP